MAEAMLLLNQKTQNESIDSDVTKKCAHPLLMMTYYNLNQSGSKQVHVGLQYDTEAKSYQPVIQLINSKYGKALDFTINSWEELQAKVEEISNYFKKYIGDKVCVRQQSRISLEGYDIILTTSYGMKSVIFAKREPAVSNETESEEPEPKKRKVFSPSIVMQKRTFDGLKNILICVEERYKRLTRFLEEINNCKKFLVLELRDALSIEYYRQDNSLDAVKNSIMEKKNILKDAVLANYDSSVDKTFVQIYFDIVFYEIIVLHYDILHDEVLDMYLNEDAQSFNNY